MAATKRTQAQREKDLAIIADLYTRGEKGRPLTLDAIAVRIGVSRQQVHYDLKDIFQRWRASSIRDFDEMRAEQLAKIDQLELQYWDAWERSCKATEQQTTERKSGTSESGNPVNLSLARIVKLNNIGDPRFLAGIGDCIDRRCKLLGLDAPQKVEHSGAVVFRNEHHDGI